MARCGMFGRVEVGGVITRSDAAWCLATRRARTGLPQDLEARPGVQAPSDVSTDRLSRVGGLSQSSRRHPGRYA